MIWFIFREYLNYEILRITIILLLLCNLSFLTFGQTLNRQEVGDIIHSELGSFGINPGDFDEFEVMDQYVSSTSGIRNIYVRQRYKDLPVFNGILNIHIKKNRVIHVGDRSVKGIRSIPFDQSQIITADQALRSSLNQLDLDELALPSLTDSRKNSLNLVSDVQFGKGNIAQKPIPAQLFWLPQTGKSAQLIWILEIDLKDGSDFWHICVDAVQGKVIAMQSLFIKCNFDHPTSSDCIHHAASLSNHKSGPNHFFMEDSIYNVYDLPSESPNHGERSIVSKPWNRAGSENPANTLGWHYDGTDTFLITRGNNVHAYEDTNNIGSGYSPLDPDLNFDFDLDFTLEPEKNIDASITNLFFWNNTSHDIFYQYGFDEASGNYQMDNLGRGGLGGDYVRAEGLDGGGMNNANFLITPDGVPEKCRCICGLPRQFRLMER